MSINRPGGAGLYSWLLTYDEAHEDIRMMALYEGPRPKGELRPIDVKPTLLCNLHCNLGSIETEPDTFMILLRDSVNGRASTYEYKGATRQRFRDDIQ